MFGLNGCADIDKKIPKIVVTNVINFFSTFICVKEVKIENEKSKRFAFSFLEKMTHQNILASGFHRILSA